MSQNNRCPHCGTELSADAPNGLCLPCLAQLGVAQLATPSDADDGQSSDEDVVTGRSFGDYELLEEIARGGMGVVYKARQRSLNRIVALKLILSGQFASKQEVLRFRGEAEAAANLRHPNIVAIYETGEHEGQHYFSMDYVSGRNLAELTRGSPLPANDAARYVKIIAEAIHYAHQQGTLHRDLKPSNVLIDDAGHPRITDFGLAKRLRGDFGLTLTGQALGSPSFMPPEQTSARKTQVGPSSDVYGMGAILYQLLTGRPPFQAETIDEIVKQLRECEPVAPRLLNASVPRDLETICLRCLEKEPQKRYATAQELSDELGRFERGEPILARPVNQLEKTWRWCRRKPAIVALTALVFLISLAGFAAVLWQLRQTERARQQAEVNLGKALEAVTKYLTQLAEGPRLKYPDLEPMRKELLQEAVPFLEDFSKQRTDDPMLRHRLALTYRSLAELQGFLSEWDNGITNATRARTIFQSLAAAESRSGTMRRELANTCGVMARLHSLPGRWGEAEYHYREVITMNERLAADFPTEPMNECKLNVSRSDLAILLWVVSRPREAQAMYRLATEGLRRLVGAHPDRREFKRELIAVTRQGECQLAKFEGALPERVRALEEALRWAQELGGNGVTSPDDRALLAGAWFSLGEYQYRLGRIPEADHSAGEAIAMWKRLATELPTQPSYKLELASTYKLVSWVLSTQNQWPDADREFLEGAKVLEKHLGFFPLELAPRRCLANIYGTTAPLCRQAGHDSKARKLLDKALEHWNRLNQIAPHMPDHREGLGEAHREFGELFLKTGQITEARESFDKAFVLFHNLSADFPEVRLWQQKTEEARASLDRLRDPAPSTTPK